MHNYLARPRSAAPVTWSVPDLCKAYDWPVGLAGGGVIAIVELGGGWQQSDMVEYFSKLGQPVPHVTDVSVDGTKNDFAHGGDANVEVALDIQNAGAAYFLATGEPAQIQIYWSKSITTAIQAAAKDGCDVCSISWGAPENEWGKKAADALEAVSLEKMVVFAAAGDSDSSDGEAGRHVDLPAASPFVVGCGGTHKPQTGAETVWNDGQGEGTGGGFSRFFVRPAFQSGRTVPSKASRMVPDVAANADPETGYEVYVGGKWEVVGGTSAVAPLYAGLFAACGEKLGDILPDLWEISGLFTLITEGSNGTWQASAEGACPCTGLGVPNGTAIAKLFG